MSIRILIVDDHQVFIDGLTAMLNQIEGMEVIGSANNGQQMVDKVKELDPNIVLSDIQMPVMDGIEATTKIHKIKPEVKIIALTMLNETLFIKKMLHAGAYGYIIKTIDKQELIHVIQKVASGKKHFSDEVITQLMDNFSDNRTTTNLFSSLTKREKEILVLIAKGLTDKEIAENVFLSPLTVTTHRKNILSKLGLKNKVELTRFAMDNNLI
ncbi:MAG: response regulator transcription factor [Bacteroidota bacterium]|nr:response regulator transcription factor [Bacteroidota bacterium]MDP3146510.1 response regulator transcription factor [Bacteroidota bacterium]